MAKKVKVNGQFVMVPDDASVDQIDALAKELIANSVTPQGPEAPSKDRSIQLRDALATERDPAKRKAIQQELQGMAPKQTETDNPALAMAKSELPGGAAYKTNDTVTKAFLGGLPYGTIHGLIAAYPSVFKGLIHGGMAALDAMGDPDKAADKVWAAIQQAPAAVQHAMSATIEKAAKDPEGYGRALGEATGNTLGATAAFAGPAAVAAKFPGALSAATNMIPGVGKARQVGRIIDAVANATGAEGAAAEGAAAGAEGAAAAPKPWTMADMEAREAARVGGRPKIKTKPGGGIKITGYYPEETVAGKIAKQAAAEAPVASEAGAVPEAAAAQADTAAAETAPKPVHDNGQDLGYTKATPNPDYAITEEEATKLLNTPEEPNIGVKRANLGAMSKDDLAALNEFYGNGVSEEELNGMRGQFGKRPAAETRNALAARSRPGAFSLGPAKGPTPSTFEEFMQGTEVPSDLEVSGAGGYGPGEVGPEAQMTPSRTTEEIAARASKEPMAEAPEVSEGGKLNTGSSPNKGRGPKSTLFEGHSYLDQQVRLDALQNGFSPEEADAAVEAARQSRNGLYRRAEATPDELYGGSER